MKDLKLYKNLKNEDITSVNKNVLISKVFENKTKAQLSRGMMAEGGEADGNLLYSPYEFLHELLPKVYGRDYVVSDDTAERYEQKILKDQIDLENFINEKLSEYGVSSIYAISNEDVIEEIEIKRKELNSKRAFVSESELQAYLFCHPELNTEHYVKKTLFDKELFLNRQLIYIDYTPESGVFFVYKYEYLSGNLYKKIHTLRTYSQQIIEKGFTQEQIDLQIQMLNEFKPIPARITMSGYNAINIHPASEFAKEFFTVEMEDWNNIEVSRSMSLKDAWKYWTETEMEASEIKNSTSLRAVHQYYTDLFRPVDTSSVREYVNSRRRAFEDGEYLFNKFMNEALNENCKARLEYMWNELYNNFTQQIFHKIPVALSLARKFKNNVDFIPNETQVQSVPYIKQSGSGLLAYGVGVGKTASSIMNVSYALDNKIAKRPVFTVPNATYEKWIKEVKGGVEKIYVVTYIEDGEKMTSEFFDLKKANKLSKEVNGEVTEKVTYLKGLLPHVNVVSLYNLNAEIVRNELKDYSELESKKINNIDLLIEYLETLGNYSFKDKMTNAKIKGYYTRFDADSFDDDYMMYAIGKSKVISKVDFLKKQLNEFKKELIYTTGTIKKFEENTIFFMTFEALQYLGSGISFEDDNTDNESVFGKVFNEFTQGESVSNILESNYGTNTALEMFKKVVYGKYKIDINEFGFDYAVFDESHNFKKVFTESKGKIKQSWRGGDAVTNRGTVERDSRKYFIGMGDKPSTIALAGYYFTRHIQENNNGNNTIQLTATPFTNKPAEIFSMLALTNYKRLKEAGYTYMQDFFDNFMDIAFDLVLTPSQQIVRKEVLLGFSNLPQMRNLIYSMMDYKSGEDANIKRPIKITYPSASGERNTTLQPTPEQDEMFSKIKAFIKGDIDYEELCGLNQDSADVEELDDAQLLEYVENYGSDAQKEKYAEIQLPLNEEEKSDLQRMVKALIEKEQKSAIDESNLNKDEKSLVNTLKGLSMLRQVTLSPYLSSCRREMGIEPTASQYVSSSPKLLYTIGCIKSIHDYEKENGLRKSGAVIYMNIGANPSSKGGKWKQGGFEKIKEYLVTEMGYNPNEISIISGRISQIQKEKEKNKFLSGQSTILIGSNSITTGVDLQNNASALFPNAFDWNPTENEQLGGRIHRQGNRFALIRMVYPMIINSADPLIFQQLTEKTNRIKAIWDKEDRGSNLSLKDFDPKKLKRDLLDNPEDKLTFWLEENTTELEDEKIILKNRLESLRESSDTIEYLDTYTPMLKGALTVLDAYKKEKVRQEGLKSFETKRNNIIDEFADDDEKLAKELSKLKKESYDYKNDPEGRYRYVDFSELSQEELLAKINTQITNTDSYWYKLQEEHDELDLLQAFFKEKFPRFYEGYWSNEADETEQSPIMVDLSYRHRLLNYANQWKGSFRDYKKLSERLAILGVGFDNIDEAREQLIEKINAIDLEIEKVNEQKDEKLKEFILEQQKNRLFSPTVEQRVQEFSEMNYILKDFLPTFAIDEARVVEVPEVKLEVTKKTESKKETVSDKKTLLVVVSEEDSAVASEVLYDVEKISDTVFKAKDSDDWKEIIYRLETAEIEAVLSEDDKETPNEDKQEAEIEFLQDKISAFKDLLEIEEDETEIAFLKEKILAFEDILELELMEA